MTFIRALLLASLLFVIAACGSVETQTATVRPTIELDTASNTDTQTQPTAQASEPTAEIVDPTDNQGEDILPNTPASEILTRADNFSIDELSNFIHERTGITGLKPDSWILSDNGDSFQISSGPEDPNGFIVVYLPGDPATFGAMRDQMFSSLKINYPTAPTPEGEVIKEVLNEDNSGSIEVRIVGPSQGDETTFYQYHGYARAIPLADAMIFTVVMIPEDNYMENEATLREMVDSVRMFQ